MCVVICAFFLVICCYIFLVVVVVVVPFLPLLPLGSLGNARGYNPELGPVQAGDPISFQAGWVEINGGGKAAWHRIWGVPEMLDFPTKNDYFGVFGGTTI